MQLFLTFSILALKLPIYHAIAPAHALHLHNNSSPSPLFVCKTMRKHRAFTLYQETVSVCQEHLPAPTY